MTALELPAGLMVIHQPVRLRIMGTLYKHRDVAFTALRDALGLTDGNLASHARTLQEHDYLDGRKVLTRQGFEMRYRITRAGSRAFQDYLAALRGFLDSVEAAPSGPVPDIGTDTTLTGPSDAAEEAIRDARQKTYGDAA